MKTKVIKTKDYAAALLPDGSVVDAGSRQELELKPARLPDGAGAAETASFRPRGKKGVKEALLAAVGSSEPGVPEYAFRAAYPERGKPAPAYAYPVEAAALGAVDFPPGAEIEKDLLDGAAPRGYGLARRRLVDKITRHPPYRKVAETTRSGIHGKPKTDWKNARGAAAESLKRDGKKDGKEIPEAAPANPALKRPHNRGPRVSGETPPENAI